MLPLRDRLYPCKTAIHKHFRYRDVALFLLAMLGHAGPIRVDLDVGPGMLRVLLGPEIALAQSLRPRGAHVLLAALREARRRQDGNGKPESNCGYSFVSNSHGQSPRFKKPTDSQASFDSQASLMSGALCLVQQGEMKLNAASPPLHHPTSA
jgi:hypothetical protein